MSRVVVLGAGVAGHTAASFLRRWLSRDDQVVVVSPKPDYNWIPSNIWVGVGLMQPRPAAAAGAIFVSCDGFCLDPRARRMAQLPDGDWHAGANRIIFRAPFGNEG